MLCCPQPPQSSRYRGQHGRCILNATDRTRKETIGEEKYRKVEQKKSREEQRRRRVEKTKRRKEKREESRVEKRREEEEKIEKRS
jgi:hypothetical protein